MTFFNVERVRDYFLENDNHQRSSPLLRIGVRVAARKTTKILRKDGTVRKVEKKGLFLMWETVLSRLDEFVLSYNEDKGTMLVEIPSLGVFTCNLDENKFRSTSFAGWTCVATRNIPYNVKKIKNRLKDFADNEKKKANQLSDSDIKVGLEIFTGEVTLFIHEI